MTIKTLEIRPKNRPSLENVGSQQLLQAVSLTTTTGFTKMQPPHGKDTVLLGRRRTIARMIRVELEVTLSLLKQALEQERNPTPPRDAAK